MSFRLGDAARALLGDAGWIGRRCRCGARPSPAYRSADAGEGQVVTGEPRGRCGDGDRRHEMRRADGAFDGTDELRPVAAADVASAP